MSLQRIVIKVGTQVLVKKDGKVDENALQIITNIAANLKKKGFDIVIVSSGAIGLGGQRLGLKPPMTTSEKQASASVGQGRLMKLYDHLFDQNKITCGQILVTATDFSRRKSYLHLRETFETLLKFGVIPIVNENDSVSTVELEENEQTSFGDNDKLSAIVASKIEADLLVVLTDVDGVYTTNPKVDSSATRISLIKNIQDIKSIHSDGKSELGRGGMAAKLEAAKTAIICGTGVWITSVNQLATLSKLTKDTALEALSNNGTVLLPMQKLKGKKKWIGTSSGYKAVLIINEGAKRALIHRNASLLSVGIITFKGDFEVGDILSVRDESEGEIARGLSRLKSASLSEILAKAKSHETQSEKTSKILIHRDELALFSEIES